MLICFVYKFKSSVLYIFIFSQAYTMKFWSLIQGWTANFKQLVMKIALLKILLLFFSNISNFYFLYIWILWTKAKWNLFIEHLDRLFANPSTMFSILYSLMLITKIHHLFLECAILNQNLSYLVFHLKKTIILTDNLSVHDFYLN